MIEIPEIIGLPPSTYVSDALMENTFPVLEITPGVPSGSNNLTSFSFKEDIDQYLNILNSYGFNNSSALEGYLKIAFIPDNFPTDTFSNEYSENFLQKMGEVASDSIGQIAQMTGNKTATGTARSFAKTLRESGVAGGDTIGSLVEDSITQIENMEKNLSSKKGAAGALGAIGSMANKLLAGARIDFPQLWKNSSYSPSYSFTVRLYNPNPSNDESTAKFIVGPLASILLLALPHAVDAGLYSWPFIHKISCPGLFILNPCYVNSINIIKGGDQQQVAWNQRLSIVDIRIDFSSLFNTMVVEKNPQTSNLGKSRPTLKTYLDSLTDYRTIWDIYEPPNASSEVIENIKSINPLGDIFSKPGTLSTPPDYVSKPSPRISDTEQENFVELKSKQPSIA